MKALKRYSLISLVLAGSYITPAMCATSNVPVSANVVGTCQFSTAGGVVFGALTPGGGAVTGTVTQPQFWCTKGTTYTLTDNKGLNGGGTSYAMKHSTLTDTIPYTFAYTTNSTANPGRGPGNPITMDISATIANGAYDNVTVGDYSDTVTLTITP